MPQRQTGSSESSTQADNSSDTKTFSEKACPLDNRDRQSSSKRTYGHHVIIRTNEFGPSKNALTSPNEHPQSHLLKGNINGRIIIALIDTGAPISVVSYVAYQKMSSHGASLITSDAQPSISGLDGNRVTVRGHIDTFFIPGVAKRFSLCVRLYVVAEKIPLHECILGMDFIHAHIANIIKNPPLLSFAGNSEVHKFDLSRHRAIQTNRYQVYVNHKVRLDAHSEITIRANIAKPHSFHPEMSLLFSAVPLRCESVPIIIHSTLTKPDKSMHIPVTMLNLSNKCCTLNAGAVLGYLEPVEGVIAFIHDDEKSESNDTARDLLVATLSNDQSNGFHTTFDELNMSNSIVQSNPELYERVKKLRRD
jgi:hypothetical protein